MAQRLLQDLDGVWFCGIANAGFCHFPTGTGLVPRGGWQLTTFWHFFNKLHVILAFFFFLNRMILQESLWPDSLQLWFYTLLLTLPLNYVFIKIILLWEKVFGKLCHLHVLSFILAPATYLFVRQFLCSCVSDMGSRTLDGTWWWPAAGWRPITTLLFQPLESLSFKCVAIISLGCQLF